MRGSSNKVSCTLLTLLVLLTTFGGSSEVFADGKKVAVGPFSGRRGARLRRVVLQALRAAGYKTAAWATTRGTLRKLGAKNGAVKLGLAAIITGRIKRRGRRWGATIFVRGADGKVRVGATWNARRTRQLIRKWPVGRKRLLAFLSGSSVAAAPTETKQRPSAKSETPPPEETTTSTKDPSPQPEEGADNEPLFAEGKARADSDEEEDAPTEVRRRRRRRDAALDISLGLQLLSRRFRYNEDLYQGLRPQTISGTAAIGGTIDWYPAAHFLGGWPTKIGITASFQHALSVAPVTFNGVDHRTGVNSMSVGLRGRHRLGRFALNTTVCYGQQQFRVEDGTDFAIRRHAIPNVAFRFVRLGGGVRVRLWFGFYASTKVAYLAVVEEGEVSGDRFFPRATADGFEAAARISYAIISGIEARVGFDLRHFGLALNPEPGDGNIVGGATDQYFTWTFGLAYRLRHRR